MRAVPYYKPRAQPAMLDEADPAWFADEDITAVIESNMTPQQARWTMIALPVGEADVRTFLREPRGQGGSVVSLWNQCEVFSRSGKTRLWIPIQRGRNHWVVVGLTKKDKLVEYFDPFGHGPPRWWTPLSNKLMEEVGVQDYRVVHFAETYQSDGHNCGPWVCWYVLERLAGKSHRKIAWENAGEDGRPNMMQARRRWFIPMAVGETRR
jgi:hypothetical protein